MVGYLFSNKIKELSNLR